MAHPPRPWEPFDWEAFLEGCGNCLVYCHGGCPDGLGAARLVSLALEVLRVPRSDIVELEHTDRADKRLELIGPDSCVFYVDISPFLEDIPLLSVARRVMVVDHHASVRARMDSLLQQMPSVVDLSETEGDHCAASLIGREMGHLLERVEVSDMAKKIALLRKKDVWHYQIPGEWAQEATAFCAYMQMSPWATLSMIDEFMNDLPACLAKGVAAMQVLQRNAQLLFDEVKVVAEADYPVDLVVIGVELQKELAYDSRHFDKLCRRHANALVLRAILYKNPEMVDIRLSRTSERVGELGALSRKLHETDNETYAGGGGHPFAAGLQVRKEHFSLQKVAGDLLEAAGAVPATIAASRRQDALDVASSSRKAPSRDARKRSTTVAPPPAPLGNPRELLRMLSRSTSCPCCEDRERRVVFVTEEEQEEEGEGVRFRLEVREAEAQKRLRSPRRRKTMR